MKVNFKINPHYEDSINFFGDIITINVESGDPGGDPLEFIEYMRKSLEDWYNLNVEYMK